MTPPPTSPPPPKARRGRKGKYNPEVVKLITDALSLGTTVADACEYANINPDTYYEWLKRHPDFSDAVKRAFAAATVSLVGRIRREADEGAWQAAAWLLERRLPDRYGRRVIQHEGSADKPLRIEVVWADAGIEDDDD